MAFLASLTSFIVIRQKTKKIKLKIRRSFLLLEIMITLTFVALSAPWIIQSSIQYLKAQSEELLLSELERVADLTFMEIQEDFYTHKIPWNSLKKKKEHIIDYPLEDFPVSSGIAPTLIKRKALIWVRLEKEGKNEEIFRTIQTQIDLKPPNQKSSFQYNFIFFVQKISKNA